MAFTRQGIAHIDQPFRFQSSSLIRQRAALQPTSLLGSRYGRFVSIDPIGLVGGDNLY